MHTIEKHGPEIPDATLKQRAIDGTNPTTGRTPIPPRANPSSQFRSWRVQLHAINDAMTRKARGLLQHTGLDQNKNPIVRGNSEGGGRGYRPNRTDPRNPTLNEKIDGYEVKFDKNNPDKTFTAFPTEKK